MKINKYGALGQMESENQLPRKFVSQKTSYRISVGLNLPMEKGSGLSGLLPRPSPMGKALATQEPFEQVITNSWAKSI